MPDVKQTIVEPTKVSDPKPYGQRNDDNLASAYPGSPIHSETYSDEEATKRYNEVLTKPASSGLGVNQFDPNFVNNGAPEVSAIEKVIDDNGNEIPVGGGAGAPTTPYVPPLTSPGAGNFSAADQGPWTGAAPVNEGEFGSGAGGTLDPAKTSGSPKIGDTLTMGKSREA
jgi:hypothetical protein